MPPRHENKDVIDDAIVKILTSAGCCFLWDDTTQGIFKDGKRLQAQREPGHSDFFFIKDNDAIAW